MHNVFTARITPRRWKQSVEWGQAVIIFLLRCSVNRLKILALTCSLILTRLQTKSHWALSRDTVTREGKHSQLFLKLYSVKPRQRPGFLVLECWFNLPLISAQLEGVETRELVRPESHWPGLWPTVTFVCRHNQCLILSYLVTVTAHYRQTIVYCSLSNCLGAVIICVPSLQTLTRQRAITDV